MISTAAKPAPEIPDDLQRALDASAEAKSAFMKLPPSHQREYLEWITSAKKEETRARRVAETLKRLTV